MKPSLYFHLSMWGTIATVLFFSSPSNAALIYHVSSYSSIYPEESCTSYVESRIPEYEANTHDALYGEITKNEIVYSNDIFPSKCDYCVTVYRDDGYPPNTSCSTTKIYDRCEDGSDPSYDEAVQGYCEGEDPPPPEPEPEGEETTCGGDGTQPNTVCLSGTRYKTGGVGVQLESGWAATCISTGESCTGDESSINPDYDLDVLPTTNDSVEINGNEHPLVESGCGEVAGTLLCTNEPNCGEFNGEWVCTGPDSGEEGVPATPDESFIASGSTTADRAGDQYYYNETTVSNSTNYGSGGTSDPADDGKADTRTDGSDSGDPNAPLGQGECPTGYVQTGVTALGDGSTEAQCAPAGDDPDWFGLADKLDFSDELPSGWLDKPEIPGLSGPSSSCPQPSEFSIAGATVEIPFDPLCDLAAMLRPFLILLGYLVAGWFVFRMVGNN